MEVKGKAKKWRLKERLRFGSKEMEVKGKTKKWRWKERQRYGSERTCKELEVKAKAMKCKWKEKQTNGSERYFIEDIDERQKIFLRDFADKRG